MICYSLVRMDRETQNFPEDHEKHLKPSQSWCSGDFWASASKAHNHPRTDVKLLQLAEHEGGHTGRLAPAASTPRRQTLVCLDPNLNSINTSSSSPIPQTLLKGAWLLPKFYASNVPTSTCQMLSFMTRGQEGAGITSRVWQQSPAFLQAKIQVLNDF